MLNKTLFTLLLLLSSLSFAQRNAVFSQNSVLGDSLTTETTYTLNEVVTDSMLLYLLSGYMPIKVDTISATSNITLANNLELIADSNKFYGTTSGDWVLVGSGDTTVNADSSLTYSNVGAELNPNPNFDFSYMPTYTSNFSSGVDSWTNNGATNLSLTGNIDFGGVENVLQVSSNGAINSFNPVRTNTLTLGTPSYLQFDYYADASCGLAYLDYIATGLGTRIAVNEGSWQLNNKIIFVVGNVYIRMTAYTGATGTTIDGLENGKNLYLKNISFVPLIAPTGWTSATMNASNYVLENANGIQFKEVTGTTSISLAGLVNGATYQVVNNLYSRTSGELNVYNGSTETAFSTSLGLDTVQVTMVGTTLTLQVDNNTDLVSSMISIKRVYLENYIALPVTTDPDFLHTISFNAKSDSANTKAYWSYGNIADSSEVLTATDTLLSINGYGQGADSLKIWVTENSEITISEPSITKLVDNFIVTKDSTEVVYFTPNTATVGIISASITLNGNKTFSFNYEVAAEIYPLFAESTVDFGNVSELATDYLTITNENENYNIEDISTTGLASPFVLSNVVASLSPNTSHDYLITFNPILLGAGTYIDTLFIYSGVDDTAQVILSGTYLGVPVATNEWVMTALGGGGWYQDFEINPVDNQKIYVVSDLGGFGYSNDGGLSWFNTNSDTGSYEMSSIEITEDGNTLYLGTSAGIYKSIDNGLNWTRLGTGQIYPEQTYATDLTTDDISVSIGSVFVHPANNNVVYAGTGYSHNVNNNDGSDDPTTSIYEPNNVQSAFPHPCKVYKSTDAGVTWAVVTGTIEPNINAVGGFAGHPTDVNIVYVATKQGLYKSTNGGTSWTRLTYERSEQVIVNPVNPDHVWYTKYTDDLYYSINGGTSFTNIGANVPLTTGSKIGDIEITEDGTKLILGTNNSTGFYSSTNNGTSWTKIPGTFAVGYSGTLGIATNIDINSDASVILGGYGNIYTTYNGNATTPTWYDGSSKLLRPSYWTSRGTSIEVVFDIAANPLNSQTVIQGHSDHGGAISLDGGLSWKNYNSTMFTGGYNEGTAIGWHPDSSAVYMALSLNYQSYPSKIFKSINGGQTWTITGFSALASIWDIEVNSSGHIYALSGDPSSSTTTEDGIWRSTDGGTSWTKLTDIYAGGSMAIAPSNEQIIYICGQGASGLSTSRPSIKKSINGGTSWTSLAEDSLGRLTSIAVHPLNPDIVFVSQTGYPYPGTNSFAIPGIYRSEDGAATWQRVLAPTNTDASNKNLYTEVMFSKTDPDVIYAVADKSGLRADIGIGEGIWISENGGDHWEQINYNLGYRNIRTIETTVDNEVYIGTGGGGAYKLGNTDVAIVTPSIASSNANVDYANLGATVTLTFNDGNSNNISAFAFVGTDTLTWDAQLIPMSVENSSDIASLYYDNLVDGETYYFKAIIQNEYLQKDTLMKVAFTMESTETVIDTFYSASSWDDAFQMYENSMYNYAYLGAGTLTESDPARARNTGMRFTSVNESLQDSTFLEIIAYQNQTSVTDIRIVAEKTANPSIFSDDPTGDDDFRTRTANLTTARIDTTISVSWADNSVQRFNITSIIQELYDAYDYTNGYITIFILNNDTDLSRVRNWYSFDDSGGAKKPKIISYGKR